MIIRTCAFTDKGRALAQKLEAVFEKYIWEHKEATDDTDEWVRESFAMKAPIVFIGAMGIAVRKIAPFVSDKLADSSVVVMDEKGEHVIPVLSGHVGGANELATAIAERTNAHAVITTATDVEELFSVDVFAVKNGMRIVNREGIRAVSSKLLKTGKINVAIENGIEVNTEEIPDCIQLVEFETEADVRIIRADTSAFKECSYNKNKQLLLLEFKPYVIGIGCKKDTDKDKFEAYVTKILSTNGVRLDEVCGMASIDLKQKEYAPVYFETKNRIPFSVYSAQELQAVEGEFAESDFVKSVTGVANVCERAAVKLAGEGGELIVKKSAESGITVAVAKKRERITTWVM